MSDQPSKSKKHSEFLEDGSRPNDGIDGWAIVSVMAIIISGLVYFLYTMP